MVRPLVSSPMVASENVIIGNTCLYGDRREVRRRTRGRAAVRKLCAAVVEGCGTLRVHDAGVVLILGDVGDNFAAGMSGGLAYVYDPAGRSGRVNEDMVIYQRIEVDTTSSS